VAALLTLDGTAPALTLIMKRILVALDGSPRAPTVLAAACELALLAHAKLVLFRAISVPVELTPDMLAMAPAGVEHALHAAARAALEQVAATIAPGLVESIEIRVGIAWDAIVRASRELDADLVVLGSHGYGALDRLLGTTAAKVANHVDRNVLIVRNAL
jgi:nucleotide-binding universal stress UspA family protein